MSPVIYTNLKKNNKKNHDNNEPTRLKSYIKD
jgi:hypothetical protein